MPVLSLSTLVTTLSMHLSVCPTFDVSLILSVITSSMLSVSDILSVIIVILVSPRLSHVVDFLDVIDPTSLDLYPIISLTSSSTSATCISLLSCIELFNNEWILFVTALNVFLVPTINCCSTSNVPILSSVLSSLLVFPISRTVFSNTLSYTKSVSSYSFVIIDVFVSPYP